MPQARQSYPASPLGGTNPFALPRPSVDSSFGSARQTRTSPHFTRTTFAFFSPIASVARTWARSSAISRAGRVTQCGEYTAGRCSQCSHTSRSGASLGPDKQERHLDTIEVCRASTLPSCAVGGLAVEVDCFSGSTCGAAPPIAGIKFHKTRAHTLARHALPPHNPPPANYSLRPTPDGARRGGWCGGAGGRIWRCHAARRSRGREW